MGDIIKQDIIKQDINFLEYPIWIQDEELANKSEDGYIWKDREGYIYRTGYKPPTKTDFIALLFLLHTSQQQGWKENIKLTKYEILKGCYNSIPGTNHYDRLIDSLRRWQNVRLEFKGTFYNGVNYETLMFGIIESVKVDENSKYAEIRFSPEWLQKIKESNYFKYINFEHIKALRSPLIIRLYEILVKTFQSRNIWAIDALKLAQKIPMNEKHIAHIIPKIKSAVNRINEYTKLNIGLTIKRVNRGKAIFIFEIFSEKQAAELLPTSGLPEVDDFKVLISILPREYQDKKTILESMSNAFKKHGFDYVKRNIEYSNKTCKTNYRVYLNKALKQDWGLSLSEDNDIKLRKINEELIKEKERLKLQEEEKLKIQKEREILDIVVKHIENLSVEEQNDLRKEAISMLDPDNQKKADKSDLCTEILIRFKMQEIIEGKLNL